MFTPGPARKHMTAVLLMHNNNIISDTPVSRHNGYRLEKAAASHAGRRGVSFCHSIIANEYFRNAENKFITAEYIRPML